MRARKASRAHCALSLAPNGVRASLARETVRGGSIWAEKTRGALRARNRAGFRVLARRTGGDQILCCVRAGVPCRADLAACHASDAVRPSQARCVSLSSDDWAAVPSGTRCAFGLPASAVRPTGAGELNRLVNEWTVLPGRAHCACCLVPSGIRASHTRRGGLLQRVWAFCPRSARSAGCLTA